MHGKKTPFASFRRNEAATSISPSDKDAPLPSWLPRYDAAHTQDPLDPGRIYRAGRDALQLPPSEWKPLMATPSAYLGVKTHRIPHILALPLPNPPALMLAAAPPTSRNARLLPLSSKKLEPKCASRTPFTSISLRRRSRNKSCRLSYHSSIGTTSSYRFRPRRSAATEKLQRLTDNTEKVNVAQLTGQEWRLSYVTPLHQFRFTQLKAYSRQLSAFILAEKQRGVAVDVELQGGFTVSFSMVDWLTNTEDNAETLFIQVNSKSLFGAADQAQKSVWRGWLSCNNGEPNYLNSLPRDLILLPLFGCSGSEAIGGLVKNWFQLNFDCCFGQLEINHTNLQWLAALWTNSHNEMDIQKLEMVLTLPVVPVLHVAYSVNSEDVWELWCSVRNNPREGGGGSEAADEEGIYIEEVLRFVKGLQTHFFRHFRLDLTAGNLSQVSTAVGSAKHGGRIKINKGKHLMTTLTLLTECALLKMPI
ncbi:centromere protein L [Neosynchiropus ocellatus]